jgi:hypothetical protein
LPANQTVVVVSLSMGRETFLLESSQRCVVSTAAAGSQTVSPALRAFFRDI